jgi:hypothetical protein
MATPQPFTLLDLASNATNTGSSGQTVTVNNVQYRTINNVACAYFNNSSSTYLSLPFTTSSQFTVSYWFYAIDGGTYDAWSVSTSATGSGGLGINPDIANGTQNFYMDCFSGGRIDPGNFALPAVSGKWIYIALSVNTATCVAKTYLNGVFKKSVTGSGTVSKLNHLILGKDATGSRAYNGYLRNFAVFNAVLTDTQVTTDYTSGFQIIYPPALTNFLELSTNATNTGLVPQTVTVAGNLQYRTIANNRAAFFDNTTNIYISLPFPSTPQFTISYWFYAADTGYYNPWALSSSPTSAGGYGINADLGNGLVHMYTAFSGGLINPANFTLPTSSGTWYHIALTVDTITGVCKTYADGVYKNTATGSGTINNSQYLILGKDGTNARGYRGYLRDFSIFNYVLTDSQVISNYEILHPNTILTPTIPVVSIGSINTTSFVATWTGGINATSYTYTLNTVTVTPTVEGKTATFTGLSAATAYSLVITAVNSVYSTSTSSTSVSATTLILPPTTPIVSINILRDTSFTATWTGAIRATSYTYYIDGQLVTPSTDAGVASNTASFTGLTPSTTYSLIIAAINSTGPTYSSITSILTLPPAPTAPIVSIGSITAVSFVASWTGDLNATSYTFTLNTVPITPNVVGKTATFTSLSPETTYSLVVTAVNTTGSIAASSVSATTLILPPTVPILSINTLRDTSFNVTWTGAIRATSYTYSINGQLVTPSTDAGVASKSASFTGLIPSTTYSLIISAINSSGATYSSSTSLTTLPPAPSPPFVTISSVTAVSFVASWISSGATSYTFTLNGTAVTPSVSNNSSNFTSLLPNTSYTLAIIATNSTGSSPSTSVSTTTLTSPTKPTGLTASITSSSFTVSWTGGTDVSSYTYLLNGSPFTPTDNGITSQTATFLGLSELTDYTCRVIAQNSYGTAASDILSVKTRQKPPATSYFSVMQIKTGFDNLIITDANAASTAIQNVLSTNVNPASVVCAALAVGTPVMFTALVNNPLFIGTTVTIPANAASILYFNFTNAETLDVTLPLHIVFPDANGVTAPKANNNTKLAIDLTVDRFVILKGTGYGINVIQGVQYFITPTNPVGTIVNVGDVLTMITDSGENLSFTVADLDIVLIPYKEPVSFICFLGSAPVLTPNGYSRIDRLKVGDVVKTPKGTAIVEAIKTQLCEPSKYSNPYVIPEGVFGANRKLLISPRHKVSVSGHMFEARQLGLEQEVQTKPFTYYNLQITGTQNMIVAGVEVESLKPLVRITVSREAFELELAKMGGMTPEIRARCHFLADGSVSVPALA